MGACWHKTFANGVDWLLERKTVDTDTNGVSFGPHSFSDVDFADDAELAYLNCLYVHLRRWRQRLHVSGSS